MTQAGRGVPYGRGAGERPAPHGTPDLVKPKQTAVDRAASMFDERENWRADYERRNAETAKKMTTILKEFAALNARGFRFRTWDD